MDQRQLYGLHGYRYPGSGIQDSKGWEFFTGHQPYRPPERPESYENDSMISSLAHTYNGNRTEGRFLGEEVPNLQRGLQFSQLYKPHFAISPGILDKSYTYSSNILPQGSPGGYGPADWTFQRAIQRRSQDGGISDVMQSESEPILQIGPRYSNSISPHGSNTHWRPSEAVEQVSPSSNVASNIPYPASSSICANCGNYPHVDGNPVYHPDRRDVILSTDWRLQGAKKQYLRPTEENVLSNRQLPTQETRFIASHNGRLGASSSGQSEPFAAVSAPDNTVNIHANINSGNNGLKKERKRKPRTVKPRKPRTLTVEGKAHAKACTHRLTEDMPTDSQDKLSPNTPWTEPLTPDSGPGYHDPSLYRSSQENDFGHYDIDW